jgi:hypothetical protein
MICFLDSSSGHIGKKYRSNIMFYVMIDGDQAGFEYPSYRTAIAPFKILITLRPLV